jgi:hypothetical protein
MGAGEMSTFNARMSTNTTQEIEAEIVGQIAIHPAFTVNGETDASSWMLSHVKSGYYFYECDGGVIYEELRRLAERLAVFDFDAYFENACTDAAFVADVKAAIERWEQGELL